MASGVGVFEWNGKLDRVPPIWACYLIRTLDNGVLFVLLLLLFVLAELLYLGEKSTDLNILAMSSGKIWKVFWWKKGWEMKVAFSLVDILLLLRLMPVRCW